MTPTEKCNELIEKIGNIGIYVDQEPMDINSNLKITDKECVKECVLVVIEEILSSVVTQAWNPAAHKYWYEVKLEVEKL